MRDQFDEVLDLLIRADCRNRHVGFEVGRAHHDLALQRVDEHDPAVVVLEEHLATLARVEERRVVEHDVGPFRASHVLGATTDCLVRQVRPGAGRIDDHLGRDHELGARHAIAHENAAVPRSDRFHVVGRAGAGKRRSAVLEHIEGEPLGVVHRCVEVGGRVLEAGVELGLRLERLGSPCELVSRHRPSVSRERVVQRQAGLDQKRAPLFRTALLVRQEAEWGCEDAREGREDRDRRLEGLDVVRRDLQQPVALGDRLANEPELAVLEVSDAPMDHVTGGCGCAGRIVISLHEHDVDALQCQVAERSDSVDSATDDEHLGRRPFADARDIDPDVACRF